MNENINTKETPETNPLSVSTGMGEIPMIGTKTIAAGLDNLARVQVAGKTEGRETAPESKREVAEKAVHGLFPVLEAAIAVGKSGYENAPTREAGQEAWQEYLAGIDSVRQQLKLPPLKSADTGFAYQISTAMSRGDAKMLEKIFIEEISYGTETVGELWERMKTCPGINFVVGAVESGKEGLTAIPYFFLMLSRYSFGNKIEQEEAATFFIEIKKLLTSRTGIKKLGEGFIRCEEYAEAFDPKYKGDKAGYALGKTWMDALLLAYTAGELSSAIKSAAKVAKEVSTVKGGLKTAGEVTRGPLREVSEEIGEETFHASERSQVKRS